MLAVGRHPAVYLAMVPTEDRGERTRPTLTTQALLDDLALELVSYLDMKIPEVGWASNFRGSVQAIRGFFLGGGHQHSLNGAGPLAVFTPAWLIVKVPQRSLSWSSRGVAVNV